MGRHHTTNYQEISMVPYRRGRVDDDGVIMMEERAEASRASISNPRGYSKGTTTMATGQVRERERPKYPPFYIDGTMGRGWMESVMKK